MYLYKGVPGSDQNPGLLLMCCTEAEQAVGTAHHCLGCLPDISLLLKKRNIKLNYSPDTCILIVKALNLNHAL